MELDHRQDQAWVLPPEPPDHPTEGFCTTSRETTRQQESVLWSLINIEVYVCAYLLLGVILSVGLLGPYGGLKLMDREDRHQRLCYGMTCMIAAILKYFNQTNARLYLKLYEELDDVGEIINIEEEKEGKTNQSRRQVPSPVNFPFSNQDRSTLPAIQYRKSHLPSYPCEKSAFNFESAKWTFQQPIHLLGKVKSSIQWSFRKLTCHLIEVFSTWPPTFSQFSDLHPHRNQLNGSTFSFITQLGNWMIGWKVKREEMGVEVGRKGWGGVFSCVLEV